jgi:hypothetical protein
VPLKAHKLIEDVLGFLSGQSWCGRKSLSRGTVTPGAIADWEALGGYQGTTGKKDNRQNCHFGLGEFYDPHSRTIKADHM